MSCTPNPSLVGQLVTCTATVTSSGGTPNAGTVKFYDTKTECTATVAGGTASCSTSTLVYGQHSLFAIYSGAAGFGTSASGYFVQTVKPNPTVTTLTSSANPAPVNQAITFTATVTHTTGTPVPTGTVSFKDYATVIGSGTLNSSAVAAFATSSLARDVGHLITAVYNSDQTYGMSQSTAITQVVNGLVVSWGTMTCTPNPSTSGSAITCSGTLTGPAAGATINFTSGPTGSTVLACTTTGAGGAFSATFTLTTKGTYGITATFPGNATYRASSVAVTQKVQ
jgi:hypothetical protein